MKHHILLLVTFFVTVALAANGLKIGRLALLKYYLALSNGFPRRWCREPTVRFSWETQIKQVRSSCV
jgi:hypothetical protein